MRGADVEAAEDPGQISNLTIVPLIGLDRASMRALAYAATLGQPVFALHISPTAGGPNGFAAAARPGGTTCP